MITDQWGSKEITMQKVCYLVLTLFLLLYSCSKDENIGPEPEPEDKGPVAVEKTNPMKLYVHYMPWFETPETNNNGNWGMHWTMATRNPENIDGDGIREIAAHYYPLIGPYASSDEDVIEYHLLLMKYAGIDGLIIDWYGSFDLYDYPLNRRNSEAVIDMSDKVGLTFAITYEDNTLQNLLNSGIIENAIEGAIADFEYMSQNYFSRKNYIEVDNDPLLTIFGPQYIQDGNDWTTILNSISKDPAMLSLWYESNDLGSNATGEFAWVYQDNTHIRNFYLSQYSKFDYALGGAYPGFNDYYSEGGWGDGPGFTISHNNGATFDATLNMAEDAEIGQLQIITWNDFGEGTMIEPTLEFGYLYLEKLQTFSGTPYTSDEFEYILKQYELRKSTSGISSAQNGLDRSFNHFVRLEIDEAKAIIDSLDQIY